MRNFIGILLLFLATDTFAQGDILNILNRDSFAPNVKKATQNCYLHSDESENRQPQSSRYFECDSLGRWNVRIETFSDGDASYDSVKYDAKTRTRVISRANDFEPSKGTTVFNKDGTIKSFLAEPAQRDAQLTEFEYDQNKRVIKKTFTFVENKTEETYTYDQLGRVLNLKRSSGSVTEKKLQLDYEEKYEYSGREASKMYAFYYGANEQVRVRDTVACTFDEAQSMTSKTEIRENSGWTRITTYSYDERGRIVGEHWETSIRIDPEKRSGNKNMKYDSLGYYSVYIEVETSYGFTNRWSTQYNEFGLPVQCLYETAATTFFYEWIYEYR